MQITNNINSGRFVASSVNFAQEERPNQTEQDTRAQAASRPSANGSTEIDQEALQRRGQELEVSRVQRLNDIESAPLRTQQALSSYQETLQSGQEQEFGELVGVDILI